MGFTGTLVKRVLPLMILLRKNKIDAKKLFKDVKKVI